MYTTTSFDLFCADAARYNALMCGVYDNGKDLRRQFMRQLKQKVEEFSTYWYMTHNSTYEGYGRYIGDAFAETFPLWFSDHYKIAYGERPHLPMWYYVHVLGLDHSEDVARMFCAWPIEEACQLARDTRAQYEVL